MCVSMRVAKGTYTERSYLQESGDEVGRESLFSPEVLLLEEGHEMVRLAPEVHGFLYNN